MLKYLYKKGSLTTKHKKPFAGLSLYHYPVEIQFMTSRNRQFNESLHVFLYKYISDNTIGQKLRALYDAGVILNEEDFRKEMQLLCAT